MLREIANSYQEDTAPVTKGHFFSDGAPNEGLVNRLYARGDTLYADFVDVPAMTAQQIKDRRYTTVSVGLMSAESNANPAKGKRYLGHVALLGADNPAVPGLRLPTDFNLSASKEFMFYSDKEGEDKEFFGCSFDALGYNTANGGQPIVKRNGGQKMSDEVNHEALLKQEREKNEKLEAQLSEMSAQLKTLNENAAKEKASRESAEDVAFCDTLVKEGKAQDGDKENLIAVLADARKGGEEQYKRMVALLSNRTAPSATEGNNQPTEPPAEGEPGAVSQEPTVAEIQLCQKEHGFKSVSQARQHLLAQRDKS